uniref:Uncharacterized protein n=1 Tax=Octopus bimaculoides TaxID=37653 RepID=A0A0L8I266_OCTBM
MTASKNRLGFFKIKSGVTASLRRYLIQCTEVVTMTKYCHCYLLVNIQPIFNDYVAGLLERVPLQLSIPNLSHHLWIFF